MGVGIHGEPGRRRVKLASADVIADEMVSAILNDFDHSVSGDVLLFVNGFGGTPAIELYLMYDAARRILEKSRAYRQPLPRRFVSSPRSKWPVARLR